MDRSRCRFGLFAAATLTASVLFSCAATPPPNWQTGGSRLDLGTARWNRGDSTIELRPDGKVMIDNDSVLGIDSAGRVFEPDGDPIAVLGADGRLIGKDNAGMGMVGAQSASFPGSAHAWFSIGPRGEVTRYDSDGDRSQDGIWQGCTAANQRACSLVTHLVYLREWQRRPRFGIGFGVGIGIPIH